MQNNNQNIALFMGGKTSDMSRIVSGFQNIWIPIHGICRWDTIELGKGKILCYHKSWDWLIPVIDKIYSNDKYLAYSKSVNINTKDIIDTYNQAVDFINWYNTIQK